MVSNKKDIEKINFNAVFEPLNNRVVIRLDKDGAVIMHYIDVKRDIKELIKRR